MNVVREPSYSVSSLVRYRPRAGAARGVRPYLALQALATFDARRHLRSYQWARVGLDRRGTQVGLGLNFDEAGPRPRVETNVGVFARREVF